MRGSREIEAPLLAIQEETGPVAPDLTVFEVGADYLLGGREDEVENRI